MYFGILHGITQCKVVHVHGYTVYHVSLQGRKVVVLSNWYFKVMVAGSSCVVLLQGTKACVHTIV